MPLKKKTSAMYGALGCAGVFAAYYLRHAKPVLDHIQAYGALGVVMGLVSLAVVAGIAAAWATSVAAQNLKQAVSAGLAVPAIIFAAGIDGGAAAKEPPKALQGFTLLAADANGSATFLESLRLVLSPVATVARAETAAVEAKAARLRDEVAALGAAKRGLDDELTAKRVLASKLEGEVSAIATRLEKSEGDRSMLLAKWTTATEEVKVWNAQYLAVVNSTPDRAALAALRERAQAAEAELAGARGAAEAARAEAQRAVEVATREQELFKQENLALAGRLRNLEGAFEAQRTKVPLLEGRSAAEAYRLLAESGLILDLTREFLARPVDFTRLRVTGQKRSPGPAQRGDRVECTWIER